jgi:hypothetical protein
VFAIDAVEESVEVLISRIDSQLLLSIAFRFRSSHIAVVVHIGHLQIEDLAKRFNDRF